MGSSCAGKISNGIIYAQEVENPLSTKDGGSNQSNVFPPNSFKNAAPSKKELDSLASSAAKDYLEASSSDKESLKVDGICNRNSEG